jgi:hypothetical protein
VALVDITALSVIAKSILLNTWRLSTTGACTPYQKAEILEAERANDEVRDILSRMVGAEIRYARMGYWVRQAPYGFMTAKIDTPHGKRCILRPEPDEGPFVRKDV